MNKKIFFSYLLSLSVCSFSLRAMELETPYIVEEPDYEEIVEVQAIVTSELTLPLLAKCLVDKNNNVVRIINVKHLGKEQITELYNTFNQRNIETDSMSFDRSLSLILSGSFDLAKGLGMGVFVGGRYLAPHVINFTKSAWSSLAEKYEEYMASHDKMDLD